MASKSWMNNERKQLGTYGPVYIGLGSETIS